MGRFDIITPAVAAGHGNTKSFSTGVAPGHCLPGLHQRPCLCANPVPVARAWQIFGMVSGGAAFVAALPCLVLNPFIALLGAVALITGAFVLLDFSPGTDHDKEDITGDRTVLRGAWEEIF